ncbi:MAG: hypothetical protein A3K04_02470 [Gallionellales bacterium RBG_16_56_9]|nr:MAG: hypothetical protein A3K04_02470 [Gallionellales bacterium RBG_16_56_9]
MMRTFPILYATILLLAAALPGARAEAEEPQRLPTISLNAGIHLIRAEVAANDAERQQGLMFRQKMGPNEGMLFVFDAPVRTCMWMKNTLIPLAVAFIDQNGTIINIEEMQEESLQSHCAAGPVVYALELNRGWFKRRNIKPGAAIDGLPGRK